MELIKTAGLCLALSYSLVSAYNQPTQKLAAAVSGASASGITAAGVSPSIARDTAAATSPARIRVAQQ